MWLGLCNRVGVRVTVARFTGVAGSTGTVARSTVHASRPIFIALVAESKVVSCPDPPRTRKREGLVF